MEDSRKLSWKKRICAKCFVIYWHKWFRWTTNSIPCKIDEKFNEVHNKIDELNATIESKIDKVRCHIIDMNANIDNRLKTFGEQVDNKLVQINEKIDNKNKETDYAIATIPADVEELKFNMSKVLGEDFIGKVKEQLRPDIDQLRVDQNSILDALEGLETIVDDVVAKPSVTAGQIQIMCRTLEESIAVVRNKFVGTHREVIKAREEMANMERSLLQNVPDISQRVDKIAATPSPGEDHNVLHLQSFMGDATMEDYSLSKLQALSQPTPNREKKAPAVKESKAKSPREVKEPLKTMSDDDPEDGDPPDSSGEGSDVSKSDASNASASPPRLRIRREKTRIYLTQRNLSLEVEEVPCWEKPAFIGQRWTDVSMTDHHPASIFNYRQPLRSYS